MASEEPNTGQGIQPAGELALRYRALLAFVGLVLVGVVGWVYLGRPTPPPEPAETPTPTQTAVRFTAVEGNVKVKTIGSFAVPHLIDHQYQTSLPCPRHAHVLQFSLRLGAMV